MKHGDDGICYISGEDESGVPVPRDHKEELDRRFERHQSDPGRLLSLEELQERIRKASS